MLRTGFAPVGVAVLLCLTLAACSQSVKPAVGSTVRQQQTVDGLTITLEMAAQPELNQPQLLTITLSDAQARPVDDADVYLDLEMSEHPMGSNKPIATPRGAGTYDLQAVYTMNGPWTITVVAERGEMVYQAVFTTTVAPKKVQL
ncbi:MAG TPA: FixH family protein [Chloroflexaceae bacterium]|nr:FixH family protein [Chloroflexaceae bacterium]